MKRKRAKFPWDLHWENKTYKLRRSITLHSPMKTSLLKALSMGLTMTNFLKRHFFYKNSVTILITPKDLLPLSLENSLTNPEEFHCSSTWRGRGRSVFECNSPLANWPL